LPDLLVIGSQNASFIDPTPVGSALPCLQANRLNANALHLPDLRPTGSLRLNTEQPTWKLVCPEMEPTACLGSISNLLPVLWNS
jgi:hypothetical protein